MKHSNKSISKSTTWSVGQSHGYSCSWSESRGEAWSHSWDEADWSSCSPYEESDMKQRAVVYLTPEEVKELLSNLSSFHSIFKLDRKVPLVLIAPQVLVPAVAVKKLESFKAPGHAKHNRGVKEVLGCDCGGPLGHCPGGIWCRKPL